MAWLWLFQGQQRFPMVIPTCVRLVPGLIIGGGIWFLQESPRWLIKQDRHEEAKLVLEKMHGNGSNEAFLELDYCEIRDTIVAEESLQVPAWSALLKQPSSRRRLFLSCGVQAFGQLSGIHVVNYYGYVIYAILGISTETSLMIVSISSALSIIYCSARLYLLDRVSRVKLLLASSVGCGLSLMVNAVLSQYYVTYVRTSNANENALRAMVAMNFVFSLFFTFIGIISWVYPAEIFPVEIRAKGNSFSTLTNQCLNLLFAQTAPIALEKMGFKFFYLFFVFNIIATVCYALFYPETKGLWSRWMSCLVIN